MNSITNEQLLEKGDFDTLYEKNKGLMIKYASRFHLIDWDDRQYVIDATFTHCIKKFDPTKGIKFSTFLGNSLYFELLKFSQRDYAKQKRLQTRSLDEIIYKNGNDTEITLESAIKSDNVSPEDSLMFYELLQNVEKLENEIERKSILLRYEGCTQAEIGKILGTSQVNISRALIRGRKNFENILNGKRQESGTKKQIIFEMFRNGIDDIGHVSVEMGLKETRVYRYYREYMKLVA